MTETATESPRTVTNAKLKSLADAIAQLSQMKVENKTKEGRRAGRLLSYQCNLALELLAPFLRPIDKEVQRGLDLYGAKDQRGQLIPSGNGIILKDPQAFNAEVAPIMEKTVTLPELEGVTWEMIEMADLDMLGTRLPFDLGDFLTGKPTFQGHHQSRGR